MDIKDKDFGKSDQFIVNETIDLTPLEEVYEKYKDMDDMFWDPEFNAFMPKILIDLWNAVKKVIKIKNIDRGKNDSLYRY